MTGMQQREGRIGMSWDRPVGMYRGAENSQIVGLCPNQPMALSCSQIETSPSHHVGQFDGPLACPVHKAHKKEHRVIATTGIAVIS